jgi:adenylate cyclase
MNDGGAAPATMAQPPAKTRGRLFRKYVILFSSIVGTALLANGAVEVWFLYRDHTELLLRVENEQAEAAATKIGQFVKEIEGQLGWTTQLPWSAEAIDQRRFDGWRLLRQAPAISELTQIDAAGRERLRVSRHAPDVLNSQLDLSQEPKFKQAMARRTYSGPVYFRRESEPYMTLAVAGTRRDAGVSVAEVNLIFIWDVVSQIKVGAGGGAYVVDAQGRLIAHPDISLVLRNTDFSALAQVQAARGGGPSPESALATKDFQGKRVLAAFAPIAPLGWWVFVELPLDEAYAPLYASIQRTGLVLLLGLAGAILAALFLARRMVVPIRALQAGAARIGSGELGARVEVKTGDEIEELADQFNTMSTELRDSKEREERVGRLRRFLSPQLAEVIESSGSETMLESHRRDVSVVFCDMRGFTAFAEVAEPEEVMAVLHEYHAALGELIHRFEGTLERFVGDGVLVLFNDPIPCPDPSVRAVRMAVEMQAAVRVLTAKWRARGHELGFGIGITHGFATMGRIGFEGRFDYSAIGSVVNLAARLCGEARDGQILVDTAVHAAVASLVKCEEPAEIALKGIRRPVKVFNVIALSESDSEPDCGC